MTLDERKAAILRAVVEGYIETAQPVGSAQVVRSAGIAVSSATVRNEMAVLEREGFLVQPHTSAGRIPTDKGYRFFVDQLTGPGSLEPQQRKLVSEFFRHAHGELERMLHDTTRLLSNLTSCAAVVVAPGHETDTVRSAQLVSLAPRVVLLVAVLSNGVVEKRTLELDAATDASDAVVGAASARLAATVVGRSLDDLAATAGSSGEEVVDALVGAAVAALATGHDAEPDQVYMGGVARMAAAFEAVDVVRQVIATLEQQFVVVSLLRDLLDRGLSVAIGAEHGLAPLAQCALVLAPYEVEGRTAGSIAVLGPTRMDYPQALAAVAVVGQRLSERLSDRLGDRLGDLPNERPSDRGR